MFEPDVDVISQHKPLAIRSLARVDDRLYAWKLPHVLSVMAATAAAAALRLSWVGARSALRRGGEK